MKQSEFNNKIQSILVRAASSGVALAVSGGADSTALLHMCANLAKEINLPLHIFTVNHNLRQEAKDDVLFVREMCRNYGTEFHEFFWDGASAQSGIQEKARNARYDMMSSKCKELGIKLLLTAHHLDDMLENYLMKKSRGSNQFGLSYSSSSFYNNIYIFRPFLDYSKQDILNYLKQHNLSWREGESNKSDCYERNRMRKIIEDFLPQEKVDHLQEMHDACKASKQITQHLIFLLAEYTEIHNEGFAIFDYEKIINESIDIKNQILSHLLAIISGLEEIPRFRSVIKIIKAMDARKLDKVSLHGCIVKCANNKLLIYKEVAAISQASMQVNSSQKWDNRFNIQFDGSDKELTISNLSKADYLKIKEQIDCDNLAKISYNNHKSILFTLPVIKRLEKIVAIPHISYYDRKEIDDNIKIIFEPNFISRFTHFI